jgi:hypothetical protein
MKFEKKLYCTKTSVTTIITIDEYPIEEQCHIRIKLILGDDTTMNLDIIDSSELDDYLETLDEKVEDIKNKFIEMIEKNKSINSSILKKGFKKIG